MQENNHKQEVFNFDKIVDIIIRLGILFLLLSWCFDILKPFILILVWAAVIAIAIYPIYSSVSKFLRGKRILTIVLLIFILLSFIVIPSVLVTESLFEGINYIREVYEKGEHLIPPPGAATAHWPSITKPIIDIWQAASDNLQETAITYSEQLTVFGTWILSAFAGIGKGILQFNVSIIIAGVFLAYSASLKEASKIIFVKLAGKNGDHFATITVMTIRNVVKGFLGVAVIQSVMAGIGFFIADVPFAGLWTVACLLLAVIQIGVGPIAIPVAIYMFSVSDTTTATVLAIWLALTLFSDNILKPILLGKNSPVPMPIVFLGAIGGFIYNGFLGLFLGAVILTIGYKLFISWLYEEKTN
jgi:predicted PurR-regulated permease PerM